MLNTAFVHPSPAPCGTHGASDVVLPAECDDVLPSGHAVTLTAGSDERQQENAPSDVQLWTPEGAFLRSAKDQMCCNNRRSHEGDGDQVTHRPVCLEVAEEYGHEQHDEVGERMPPLDRIPDRPAKGRPGDQLEVCR